MGWTARRKFVKVVIGALWACTTGKQTLPDLNVARDRTWTWSCNESARTWPWSRTWSTRWSCRSPKVHWTHADTNSYLRSSIMLLETKILKGKTDIRYFCSEWAMVRRSLKWLAMVWMTRVWFLVTEFGFFLSLSCPERPFSPHPPRTSYTMGTILRVLFPRDKAATAQSWLLAYI